jgi:hypothetical protein
MLKLRQSAPCCGLLLLSLVLLPAHAGAAPLGSATNEQVSAASAAYVEGMDAFNRDEVEPALAAFERSYSEVASPNSHLMIARCLVRLERLLEAQTALEQTIAEAAEAAKEDAKYAATESAAQEEAKDLRPRLAWLKLEVPEAQASDTIELGGKALLLTELSASRPALPGVTHVRWVRGDRTLAERTLTLRAGEEQALSLHAEPEAAPAPSSETSAESSSSEPERDPHRRTYAYVAGGVGIVGLASFVVFGILDNGQHSTLSDDCRNNICGRDLAADASSGRTFQGLANAGLIVGIVGLGTAAGLYLSSSPAAGDTPSDTAEVELRFHARGVNVTGRF